MTQKISRRVSVSLTMRLLTTLLLMLSAAPAIAHAGQDQRGVSTPIGAAVLSDFWVYAHIDAPNMTRGIPFVSRSTPLVIGGWAFECRSGLQPATQRVGDLAVSLTEVNTSAAPPFTVTAIAGARPDVPRAFPQCPAVGSGSAGFSLVVNLSDVPPGMYRLSVLADTFDYVGRYAFYLPQPITIIVTD